MNNKPDWKNAPKWANWLSQDENGEWWWYEEKPKPNNDNSYLRGTWSSYEGVAGRADKIQNWKNTLEERPNE